MSETVEQRRGTVFYGKKISDGNYGSEEFGIHVQFDMDDEQSLLDANVRLAFDTAKEHVFLQAGITAETDAQGVLRATFPGIQGTTNRTQPPCGFVGPQRSIAGPAALPAPTAADGSRPTVRVIKAWGEVPEWLIEAAAKAGVPEVFDNRSKLKCNGGTWSDSSPWFKEALPKGADTSNAKGFWPPK